MCIEETDVMLFSDGKYHGIFVMDQLDDGHLHVRGGVPGEVEVDPGGVAGVVVAHRVEVLAHPGRKHTATGSYVIEAAFLLLALYGIYNIFMRTIHFSIDFHGFSSCFGLHGLAHLDVVAHLAEPGALGHAAPVPPGAGGAGGPRRQLRPRQLVAERGGPPERDQGRLRVRLLQLRVRGHHRAPVLGDNLGHGGQLGVVGDGEHDTGGGLLSDDFLQGLGLSTLNFDTEL